MEASDNMMNDLKAVLADAEELLRAPPTRPARKCGGARARQSLRAAREHLKGAGSGSTAGVRESVGRGRHRSRWALSSASC
jgi:ElaB/YqjD/DUF883 family membrane-anchored ribosome-binding protein